MIAGLVPERARLWLADDPRRLYLVTVPLVAFTGWQLVRAIRLHVSVEAVAAQYFSDAARAASEALGG